MNIFRLLRGEEPTSVVYMRRVKEEREARRALVARCANTERAAVGVLRLYGADAVDAFYEKLRELESEKHR